MVHQKTDPTEEELMREISDKPQNLTPTPGEYRMSVNEWLAFDRNEEMGRVCRKRQTCHSDDLANLTLFVGARWAQLTELAVYIHLYIIEYLLYFFKIDNISFSVKS